MQDDFEIFAGLLLSAVCGYEINYGAQEVKVKIKNEQKAVTKITSTGKKANVGIIKAGGASSNQTGHFGS